MARLTAIFYFTLMVTFYMFYITSAGLSIPTIDCSNKGGYWENGCPNDGTCCFKDDPTQPSPQAGIVKG